MGYGRGMGDGQGSGMGYGQGSGMGSFYGRGPQARPYMGAIDQNDPRYKMFQETEKERVELYQKHTELQGLLAVQEVDEDKIRALHQEIIELQNQIREKHLQFTLTFKKNNPDWQPGYRGGWGRGSKFRHWGR